MSFTVIEILKENNDQIEKCRVLGMYSHSDEAIYTYNNLKEIISNKIIIVSNISMQDIPRIFISDYYCDKDTP